MDEVVIGDNIVVPCESENGDQFWLILCDKLKHVVIETLLHKKIPIMKEMN